MVSLDSAHLWHLPSALPLAAFTIPVPPLGQDEPAEETVDESLVGEAAVTPDAEVVEGGMPPATDILSANTLSLVADGRVVLADGHQSWIEGGFGKTRFDGKSDSGDLQPHAQLTEFSLIWQPRFTRTINANISASYQHGFDDEVFDVMEGYLTFIPSRRGKIG